MTRVPTAGRRWSLEARLGLIAGLVAVLWSLLILDPFGPSTIDPDASSSVLYFLRIVDGPQLEAFVPTTPKPLLTLVYGITWSLAHDWRTLVWGTILVWGVAVGATAAFVARIAARIASRVVAPAERVLATPAGTTLAAATWPHERTLGVAAIAAAAFATVGLLVSSDLMLEVSRANSLVWALAGWSIASLAITAQPSRPRLAGLMLLLAGLCRFETLALAAVAVVATAFWLQRRNRGSSPLVPGIIETGEHFQAREASVRRRRTADVSIGVALSVAAIPVAMAHDWLLTGDPFYWLTVPSRYTAIFNVGLPPIGPFDYAGTFAGRLAPDWLLVVLAVVGLIALVRGREWLGLAGIAAIGLGVSALLFLLAARATYISNRYYEPIELALIVSSAIGAGSIAAEIARRLGAPRWARGVIVPLAGAASAVVAIAALWPALPWDRRASTELSDVRNASTHAAAIAGFLDSARTNFERAAEPSAVAVPTLPSTSFGVLVPSRDVSRFAVELDMRLTTVGDLYAAVLAGAPDNLRAGQWIVHDAAADRPVRLFTQFEIDAPSGRLTPAIGLPPEITSWMLAVR